MNSTAPVRRTIPQDLAHTFNHLSGEAITEFVLALDKSTAEALAFVIEAHHDVPAVRYYASTRGDQGPIGAYLTAAEVKSYQAQGWTVVPVPTHEETVAAHMAILTPPLDPAHPNG